MASKLEEGKSGDPGRGVQGLRSAKKGKLAGTRG